MVAEEFSTPKVVAGGQFIEFTYVPAHKKLYLRPEAVLGVEEGESGSVLITAAAEFIEVEQEFIQIVAVLARLHKKVPGNEPSDSDPFYESDVVQVYSEGAG